MVWRHGARLDEALRPSTDPPCSVPSPPPPPRQGDRGVFRPPRLLNVAPAPPLRAGPVARFMPPGLTHPPPARHRSPSSSPRPATARLLHLPAPPPLAFFISPAYCVPRMTISLCLKLRPMLASEVLPRTRELAGCAPAPRACET
eukprot:353583-Chlamydomonas_euryale.AAC.2